MKSPVSKVIVGLTCLMALTGAGVAYNHFFKPDPPPIQQKSKQKKRTTKRTYQDGKIATEEVQEFLSEKWTKPVIKPKPYLFGVTLGYDEKIKYNVMAGKQITSNCYAIGKVSTEFNTFEAGALCVF